MKKNKKILVLALSGIGDALMFTPALNFIKQAEPDAIVDVLVMFKGVKDIYDRIGLANNVIFFDFMKEGAVKSLKFIFSLRNTYNYSINVYPSNRKEYNIISFLIGAKKRGAVEYLRCFNSEFGFLNNCRVKENDLLHNVEENIKICEKLFDKKAETISPLILKLNSQDEKFANDYVLQNSLQDKLIIGIHAGCSLLKNHMKRRWEPEKFIELSKKIIDNKNAHILIFGGPDETELKDFIKTGINSPNVIVVKSSSLTQSAALMKYCSLFISNDSGLMHIAAAMQTKLIPVIGPTSLNYIHPWKCDYKPATIDLECAPCFIYSPRPLSCSRNDVQFKCIKELSVEKVYSVVNNFLL